MASTSQNCSDGITDSQMENGEDEELTIEQQSERVHLIFHLSHPKGTSLYDYTLLELCSVKYKNFDNAVRMCLKSGEGSFMAKSDMKSAFRNLLIWPHDWHWLVMRVLNPYTREERKKLFH